jgi:hypothetical protein
MIRPALTCASGYRGQWIEEASLQDEDRPHHGGRILRFRRFAIAEQY